MTKAVLASLLLLSGMLQQVPSAFPRPGARQLIDNERVAVWDVTWEKGKPTPMFQNKFDMVTVDLENAEVRVTGAKGKAKPFTFKVGQAGFIPKGSSQMEEGTSDPARHAIVVELKDLSCSRSHTTVLFRMHFREKENQAPEQQACHGLGLHVDERRPDSHALPYQRRCGCILFKAEKCDPAPLTAASPSTKSNPARPGSTRAIARTPKNSSRAHRARSLSN